jgi:HEPN domain-containing protein
MKPPEDEIRRLVLEWLRKADLDFQTVDGLCSEDPFRDIVVFHAQQAECLKDAFDMSAKES